MKVVKTRMTTKTSKSKTATKQVAPKQKGRKWIELTPTQFRDRFINLVGKPASLPYPEKGGRRSDLALASAPWIRKALDGDVIKTFKRPVMVQGFLAMHASRLAEPDSERKWPLADTQALSWAKQMATRLLNLLRHSSQAQPSNPGWLTLALNPTKEEPTDNEGGNGNGDGDADGDAETHEEEEEAGGSDDVATDALASNAKTASEALDEEPEEEEDPEEEEPEEPVVEKEKKRRLDRRLQSRNEQGVQDNT